MVTKIKFDDITNIMITIVYKFSETISLEVYQLIRSCDNFFRPTQRLH